jgi:hypothetical protein
MFERTRLRQLMTVCVLLATSSAQADHARTSAIPKDPPITVKSAQPKWRWIGERTNTEAKCPDRVMANNPLLPNWTIRPLFCTPLHPGTPDDGMCKNEPSTAIPPGLRAFCSYEWTPTTNIPVPPGDLDDLQKLVTAGKLLRIDPDSMAVAGFGDVDTLKDQVWVQFENQFKNEVGLPTVPLLDPAPLVRVAVVDTQPTTETNPDREEHNSPHGNALVNMAEDLLCDDNGNCAAMLASRLALGYICPLNRNRNPPGCRDPVFGGWLGTIGNLARAVRLEVRGWLPKQPVPGHRLVLNLSVAWDPRFGGLEANIADMPAPVHAVYAALADAQCRGALAIAAAGNVTAGPEDQSGPLLPAAWGMRRAPTNSDCQSRLGFMPPAIFPPAGSDTRPFVYAVAGVRGDGTALANARPDSEPSLVAYGDHANAIDESLPGPPDAPTATLTGSSVSALAVSTSAAAVWFAADQQPAPPLKPYQIMDLLYDNGIKLGRDADFCRDGTPTIPCPGNPPEVTEVQMCAAIDAVAGTATCPVFSPLQLTIDDTGFQQIALSALGNHMTDPGCLDDNGAKENVYFAGAVTPPNPCPFDQYYSQLATPWTAPQPPDSPCPSCGTGSQRALQAAPVPTRTLFMEVDDAQAWTLTDATLQCSTSTFTSLFKLPLTKLASGDQVTLTLDDDVHCPAGSELLLYFIDQLGRTTVDAVLQAD